ncbi:hypothetical protein CYMTET_21346 [Cymbomonas tetramitiformis]|uniref:Uncharacterized protein n=1 Tax=Cymbomonas tetramitiformis TaxID=36881 RepID=A0AAE0L2Y6_9CHLO|nr:hypothetical protein CYMTET_21346 [Cymbomonas tetramitiformis]
MHDADVEEEKGNADDDEDDDDGTVVEAVEDEAVAANEEEEGEAVDDEEASEEEKKEEEEEEEKKEGGGSKNEAAKKSSSGDSLYHRNRSTQTILTHCKSPAVALHVSTEKSMYVTVNGQHEGEPQRKDGHPDEHGRSDKPKSEQSARSVTMASTLVSGTCGLNIFMPWTAVLCESPNEPVVICVTRPPGPPAERRSATMSPLVPSTRRVGRQTSPERVTGDILVHQLLLASVMAFIMDGIAGCAAPHPGPPAGGAPPPRKFLDGLFGLPMMASLVSRAALSIISSVILLSLAPCVTVYPVEAEGATDEASADIGDGVRVQGGLGVALPLCAGLRESSDALLTSSPPPVVHERAGQMCAQVFNGPSPFLVTVLCVRAGGRAGSARLAP